MTSSQNQVALTGSQRANIGNQGSSYGGGIGQTRLGYSIQEVSSEDPAHQAHAVQTDYNFSSMAGKGWHTRKFCEYPQTMILKFEGPSRLKQIQVLAHEFKIASRVELYFLPLDATDEDQYVKVGHFSFENVQRPSVSQKMRELKSVHFDAVTMLLKLVLYAPHENKDNIFKQVGLISVSVIGEQLGFAIKPALEISDGNNLIVSRDKPQKEVQEEEFEDFIQEKLRELRFVIQEAREGDDLAKTKKLWAAEDLLVKMGIRRINLDQMKKVAIDNEDYMTAKMLNLEITDLNGEIKKGVNSKTGNVDIEITQKYFGPPTQFPTKVDFQNGGPRKVVQLTERDVKHTHREVQTVEEQKKVKISKHAETQVIPAVKKRTNFNQQMKVLDMQIAQGKQPTPQEVQEEEVFEDEEYSGPLFPLLDKKLINQLMQMDSWQLREEGLRKINDNIEKYVNSPHANSGFNHLFTQFYDAEQPQVASALLKMILSIMQQDSSFNFENIDRTITFIVDRGTEPRNAQLSDKVNSQLLKHLAVPLDTTLSYLANASKRQTHLVLLKRLKFMQKATKDFDQIIEARGETQRNPLYPTKQVVSVLENTLQNQDAEVRQTSQEILYGIYDREGFEAVEASLAKLPQKSLQTMVWRVPELKHLLELIEANGSITKKTPAYKAATKGKNGPKNKSKSPVKLKSGECQFCGITSPDFTNTEKLDLHYVLNCSMLTNCVACTQIIEVGNYTEHKLEQCEKKHDFRQCPRCKEAIELDFFEQHVVAQKCHPFTDKPRCPLCHTDIKEGSSDEEAFKIHLAQKKCTAANVRAQNAKQKTSILNNKKPEQVIMEEDEEEDNLEQSLNKGKKTGGRQASERGNERSDSPDFRQFKPNSSKAEGFEQNQDQAIVYQEQI